MTSMPQSLPKIVHQALKEWFDSQFDVAPWRRYASATRTMSDTGDSTRHAESLAVKNWILRGLRCLEGEDDRAAELLRRRFLDGEPGRKVANRLNVSEGRLWQLQQAALVALAQCLWREEIEAIAEKRDRILARLEIAPPVHLFGVGEKQSTLLSLLEAEGPPWVVAVAGVGGIGKTSLVDGLVRQVATQPAYVDVGWVSARQSLYTLWGGLHERPEQPALTVEGLIDAILDQFGLVQAGRLPYGQKLAQAKELLRSAPHLVVVDNLETAADYREIIQVLPELYDPSRFLLTSRHSLRAFSGVYNLTLDELSPTDSLDLVRHEAGLRGFDDLAAAPKELLLQIYQVVGGNPLALKLVVGQSHALPLTLVLKNVLLSQGQAVEELYRYLYWHSWQILSQPARQVLGAMPVVAEQGGKIDQIVAISRLPEEVVGAALTELLDVSLVNRVGGLQSARYALHQLTETFLVHEVLKW